MPAEESLRHRATSYFSGAVRLGSRCGPQATPGKHDESPCFAPPVMFVALLSVSYFGAFIRTVLPMAVSPGPREQTPSSGNDEVDQTCNDRCASVVLTVPDQP